MATGKSISFRAPLVANATDLIAEIKLDCAPTAKLIASLVSHIAAYTEEGIRLTPRVFICRSIGDLIKRSGTGEYVTLSSSMSMDAAATKILKAAAPLCGQNWSIFIERADDASIKQYGVFCGSTDPSALTIDEVLMDEFEDGFPIVRIHQTSVNKVEVKANSGRSIEFRFNDDTDAIELNTENDIDMIADAISASSPEQAGYRGYVRRVLRGAITRSHGALVAILPSGVDTLPSSLDDAVRLLPPIDLKERLIAHMNGGQLASSGSKLQAASELVGGLIASDGITVFNEDGKILAYRGFVKVEDVGTPSMGGARSRAFAALEKLVGKSLTGALFRSQDGRTQARISKVTANV